MFNDKTQQQEGGDNSSNFQGQTVNVYNGISYRDAKEIALDVFQSNFLILKNEAAQIAKVRAEEITEKFLSELNEKSPESIQAFNQPGLQDALFTVQKEFAKSGDEPLGDLLVDILVDRAQAPVRNFLQIVLDEALKTAPRLTVDQIDLITLNFILVQTIDRDVTDLERLIEYIARDILPFCSNLIKEKSAFNYIEYLGCGHIRAGNYGQLEQSFFNNYKGLFQKGFTKEEFITEVGTWEEYESFHMSCLHDLEKFQIKSINDKSLDEFMSMKGLSDEQQGKLRLINSKYAMQPSEVKQYLILTNPKMNDVFDMWENSQFNNLELTSVGIAIAHANYRRKTGQPLDLSIWVR